MDMIITGHIMAVGTGDGHLIFIDLIEKKILYGFGVMESGSV